MRATLLLSICIGVCFTLSAQTGSTPINGQNPALKYSTSQSVKPSSPQDGSTFLGATYSISDCGVNYTTASQKIGMRFPLLNSPSSVQPATFAISGIPASAVIQKAYVWCEGSGTGIPITLNVTNPLANSSPFPMTMIGQDQDKCWGYTGTFTYRVDVTSHITGNGNYTISGFPTNPPTAGNDIDGATMMVIWSDPTQTWQGDIVIWDGCVVINGGTTTQTITGFTACTGTVSNARAFMAQGDLQNLNSQLTLNGVFPIVCVEDWWNWIDVATTVTPGQTSSAFGNSSGGDCYNFCVMGLYWQSNCSSCCPTPFLLDMDSIPSTCSASIGTATATPLGGSGNFTYTWNTVPVQITQTAVGLPPGTYVCSVTDALGCTTVDSVVVLGTGILTFTQVSTNNICYGDTIGTATFNPTGGNPPYTYVWSPNVSNTNAAINLGAGIYTVNVSDNYGCQTSATFTITEPANVPIVGTISGPSPICIGQSSILTVSVLGGAPPYTYSWINAVNTTNTITVSPTTTTTYSVIIVDACFTIHDTAVFTLIVNPLPVISYTGDILSGCAPHCVTFTPVSNSGIGSCAWNFGDNSYGIGANPTHCYINVGSFTVTLVLSDNNGCVDSMTIANYINTYPTPVAAFNITSENPSTLLEPVAIIDDLSIGGDTCYWDFGDGNTLIVVGCGDVSNTYADTGLYQVTEIVVNQYGCADTIRYDIYVNPYTSLFVPNTFTPNGNGLNEIFFAIGEYVDDFHMMVFDRWGNMIFESYDQLKGWDGKANDGKKLAQIDTYVWVINYREINGGKKRKVIGHVNLIR